MNFIQHLVGPDPCGFCRIQSYAVAQIVRYRVNRPFRRRGRFASLLACPNLAPTISLEPTTDMVHSNKHLMARCRVTCLTMPSLLHTSLAVYRYTINQNGRSRTTGHKLSPLRKSRSTYSKLGSAMSLTSFLEHVDDQLRRNVL